MIRSRQWLRSEATWRVELLIWPTIKTSLPTSLSPMFQTSPNTLHSKTYSWYNQCTTISVHVYADIYIPTPEVDFFPPHNFWRVQYIEYYWSVGTYLISLASYLSLYVHLLTTDTVDLPQDSWTVELKARLVQFLKSTLPDPTDEPMLVNLYLDVSNFLEY